MNNGLDDFVFVMGCVITGWLGAIVGYWYYLKLPKKGERKS